MRMINFVFLCIFAMILSGCSLSDVAEIAIPEDSRDEIEVVLGAIENRNTEAILELLDETEDRAQWEDVFPSIWDYAPDSTLQNSMLLGSYLNTFTRSGYETSKTLRLQYKLEYESKNLLLILVFVKQGEEDWQINGFRLNEIIPQQSLHFNFGEMSQNQQVAIGLGIGIPIFIILTLIASFRFKKVKRRILWTLFILIGTPVWAFNWSTETWSYSGPGLIQTEAIFNFQIFKFLLLGASFLKSGISQPWVIGIALPLGALLFWYRVFRGGPTRKGETEQRVR